MKDDDEKMATKDNSEPSEEEKAAEPLATVREVFSFAETFQTKLYIAIGLFWAMVAGLAMPASLFFFARVMGNISAIAQEGLHPILKIIYTLMILGVISFVSETLKGKFEKRMH